MNKDIEQLKPCPFCGEKPELYEFANGFDIECINEKCEIQVSLKSLSHKEKQAIEKWNKRVEQ